MVLTGYDENAILDSLKVSMDVVLLGSPVAVAVAVTVAVASAVSHLQWSIFRKRPANVCSGNARTTVNPRLEAATCIRGFLPESGSSSHKIYYLILAKRCSGGLVI